jgi:hypothetical protein
MADIEEQVGIPWARGSPGMIIGNLMRPDSDITNSTNLGISSVRRRHDERDIGGPKETGDLLPQGGRPPPEKVG